MIEIVGGVFFYLCLFSNTFIYFTLLCWVKSLVVCDFRRDFEIFIEKCSEYLRASIRIIFFAYGKSRKKKKIVSVFRLKTKEMKSQRGRIQMNQFIRFSAKSLLSQQRKSGEFFVLNRKFHS